MNASCFFRKASACAWLAPPSANATATGSTLAPRLSGPELTASVSSDMVHPRQFGFFRRREVERGSAGELRLCLILLARINQRLAPFQVQPARGDHASRTHTVIAIPWCLG